ncbi:MAG: thioredoxin family protein [Rhizobiaceae bacterium]|nr:protein-disulfide reductase DsbD domain-containing protein [Pseudooceanicola sediminis]MCB1469498.1 thioredoxin family protein [Rhizobiaceae bacterium]|tara:strand:+ start:22771 stop:24897 length:2127 start_codon:yes stop_codon:yes gene_type:complete
MSGGLKKRIASLCGKAFPVLFALIAILAFASMAAAAESESFANPAVEARLITAENGVGPDAASISAGLHLRLGKDWKTYWRSPGEVGLPPTIDWTGSENVAETNFLWPAPKRFTAFGIENFGYQDEVVFPIRITLSEPGGPTRLNARVSLLICSTVCVPQDFALSLTLPRASGIDKDAATQISTYAARVPDDGTDSGIGIETAHLDASMTALTVTARSDVPFEAPDIFPELGEGTAFGKPDVRLGQGDRLVWARLPVLAAAPDLPELQITVTDGSRAATLQPALSDAPPEPPFSIAAVVPGMGELAWIAAIAFLGGLILNVMPCVLPVLSIKLSSAITSAGQSPARIRTGFAISALGVLAFMWVLAAATLGARALGLTVGWGLQFQSPVFLAIMFVVLVVFAANLFGLFDIALPTSWQTRLARAGGGKGYGGDFATGAFAAILATPCSAPFLGTAVAFALAGRSIDIAVIFTALGLGLSLPYVIIAAFPHLVGRLPRPGQWMIVLKIVLGLALAGTAAWLFWVLTGVAGQWTAVWVGALSLSGVALLSLRRVPGMARVLGAAVLSVVSVALAGYLSDADKSTAVAGTEWAEFDRSAIARHISIGQVVFVDVTADWCLTCKANKALVLDRDPVVSRLRGSGVIAMQADWTRPSETISRYLESFGRYGIPFNAVYGPGAPDGVVLPELLSSEAVLEALSDAGSGRAAATQ